MAHSLAMGANGRGPGASPKARAEPAHRDGLDWDAFRELYHPDSRRHDFEAIAAYGAHRRSHPLHTVEEAGLEDGRLSPRAAPLEAWEDEGGAAARAA